MVDSEWMTWWIAKGEEKKDGRKSVQRVDWLQIVKTASSVKVLGFDFSHSGNSIIVKLFFLISVETTVKATFSNFSGEKHRVF